MARADLVNQKSPDVRHATIGGDHIYFGPERTWKVPEDWVTGGMEYWNGKYWARLTEKRPPWWKRVLAWIGR